LYNQNKNNIIIKKKNKKSKLNKLNKLNKQINKSNKSNKLINNKKKAHLIY
jgi:hypothetical protein